MSLKEYRAKRNFSVSPEPQGTARPGRGGRASCSSASRNIWRAICTTTSGSSTTACCSPGPSQGAVARSEGQAPGDESGRPSDRVRRLRGRHSRRLWDGHRDALGSGLLGAARGRCGRRAEEGRSEAAAERGQTERILGADSHRRRWPELAAAEASRRMGRARSTSPPSPPSASRAAATSPTSSPPRRRRCGRATAARRAAPPA